METGPGGKDVQQSDDSTAASGEDSHWLKASLRAVLSWLAGNPAAPPEETGSSAGPSSSPPSSSSAPPQAQPPEAPPAEPSAAQPAAQASAGAPRFAPLSRTASAPAPSSDNGGAGRAPALRPPALQRAQSMFVQGAGRPTAGRLAKTRSTSAERAWAVTAGGSRRLAAGGGDAAAAFSGEERGSSLPPPAQRGGRLEEAQAGVVAAPAPAPRPQLARQVSAEVQLQVRSALKFGAKALDRDVRRQLRILVGGLQGSGKSTMCRMLADLLDGTWVNQDEFAHKGKGAKTAFLNAVKEAAKDRKIPVLIVDKINTMRQHRQGIVEAMRGGAGGDVVYVQVAHPLDGPGQLRHQVELCLERIRGRGAGHRTLMGDDPKLQKILRMTASGVEPMNDAELADYAARYTADMTQPPTQVVMQLLTDLYHAGLLGRFDVDELVTEERLQRAMAATHEAEGQLRTCAADPAGRGSQGKEAGQAGKKKNQKKEKKQGRVMFYEVRLDQASSDAAAALWRERGAGEAPQGLEARPGGLHVTLLYVAGRSNEQILGKQPHLGSMDAIESLRTRLAELEGTEVEFQIEALVWDDRIAAAQVSGLPDKLCANVVPHITLAHKPNIPPSLSNEVLLRRATQEEFQGNLLAWLNVLDIAPRYWPAVEEWCASSGASFPEELATSAADLAAHLEPEDGLGADNLGGAVGAEDRRARLRTSLTQSVPGRLGEVKLQEPLRIRGRVGARRPGD